MSDLAPSDEACVAIVDRINAPGSGYELDVPASYSYQEIDPLEAVSGLRVDVVPVVQRGQSLRIDGLDESIHEIRIWIRTQVQNNEPDTIAPLNLLRNQIMAWVDNWDSDDRRVRVWDSENEDMEQPVKAALRERMQYVACIVLEVRVDP